LLSANTALNGALDSWVMHWPNLSWVVPVAQFLTSTFLITLLFAFTFRFMSDGQLTYPQILVGAVLGGALFSLGEMAITYYLSHVFQLPAFGAAGSLVAFLVWVYYSAQIFFFGAEIIRAHREL